MTRGVLDRAASLAAVLRRDPQEFVVRISAIVAGRFEPLRRRPPKYEPIEWAVLSSLLPNEVGNAFRAALAEPELVGIEDEVMHAMRQLPASGIDSRHNGDVRFARCCYALARALRPAIVVETGVAHGVSTAFILAALDRNGAGTLHSIDLPPHDAGAADYVGALVPVRLRGRWSLHRGMANRVLPRLTAELGRIDMFVHDSLHTYHNMTFEFDAVWRVLREGGAVVADDVEGNRAFLELQARRPHFWTVCSQASKPALFGVAMR